VDLADLITRYVDDHLYGVSSAYRKQLGYSVAIFSSWLSREATLADLTRDRLNPYVDWLRTRYAPDTARTQRGNLLCLWRYAVEHDLTDAAPIGVRRLRMPQRRPQAWTPREVAALADGAGRLPGRFRGTRIRRGPNLRAFVLVAWDTGYRLGDLLSLSPAKLHTTHVAIVQHKTQVEAVREISEATWLAVACTVGDDPNRSRIWPACRTTYQDWIRRLLKVTPVRPGSIKWIRRGVATAAEALTPGAGTRALGHTRADTAVWYLDRSQLETPFRAPPLPPPESEIVPAIPQRRGG
jgi:integrase